MTRPSAEPPRLAVVDAAGASAADARAIAAGVPGRALMQRAGALAASLLAEQFAGRLAGGVLVATGGGNNGGDGWVLAHALHAVGIPVDVAECVPARTPDAEAERAIAVAAGVRVHQGADAMERVGGAVVVDALLGTGFRATELLRGEIARGVAALGALRAAGASVVAIDVPSGLDASDGTDAGAVAADLTVTFGTLRRGHLVARALCGRIVVADIGLGAAAHEPGGATLGTAAWFRHRLPRIAADAHKGTRGKVAIVGGAPGMAGAVTLAARGALRSGAGMVKCLVSPESLRAVQAAEPAALTAEWPGTDDAVRERLTGWADAVLIGPGLGSEGARAMVERILAGFDGPVVLDADALNAFAGDLDGLAMARGPSRLRPLLLTPHPLELGRLASLDVGEVLARRFTLPAQVAAQTGAALLLKGQPTIISSAAGDVTCVAEGTPVLATGGSGDVLGGIAATLLAQTGDAALAGALAAFAHGHAARLVSARQVRGFTLEDVIAALPQAWSLEPSAPRPGILAELPAVGEA